MKSKLCIAAAVCLLLAAGWGCEKEQCQAGVRNGKVEIPEKVRAYFDFPIGTEWNYTNVRNGKAYYIKVLNRSETVGVGEEETIRCVLGRNISIGFISDIDTISNAYLPELMILGIGKDIENDYTNISLNFNGALYNISFRNPTEFDGFDSSKVKKIEKYPLGEYVYQDVVEVLNLESDDTLYFAKDFGLVHITGNGYDLKVN